MQWFLLKMWGLSSHVQWHIIITLVAYHHKSGDYFYAIAGYHHTTYGYHDKCDGRSVAESSIIVIFIIVEVLIIMQVVVLIAFATVVFMIVGDFITFVMTIFKSSC